MSGFPRHFKFSASTITSLSLLEPDLEFKMTSFEDNTKSKKQTTFYAVFFWFFFWNFTLFQQTFLTQI